MPLNFVNNATLELMDINDIINEYTEVKDILYRDERYSVRDNGSVFRYPKESSKKRKLDSHWTFGLKDKRTGYMMIGNHRVHIIVASAFQGNRDSKLYVVNHIDTNRCNNRTENLRWLTKLENALNNPVTRKRIEYLCGGNIQMFINNPNCLRDLTGKYQDVMWMRTVTKEEAKNAYERVMSWAENKTITSTGVKMGEWMYKPYSPVAYSDIEVNHNERGVYNYDVIKDNLTISLTQNAMQKDWRTPTEFPFCPANTNSDAIPDYYKNLEKGAVFCRNIYGEGVILDFAISSDHQKMWVATDHGEKSIKRWALAEVLYEDGKFIHSSLGTFFEQDGAMKYFTLAQGKEWTGNDPIDDYC